MLQANPRFNLPSPYGNSTKPTFCDRLLCSLHKYAGRGPKTRFYRRHWLPGQVWLSEAVDWVSAGCDLDVREAAFAGGWQ